ncbi:MAG TPA: hypothetical protein VIX59_05640 [Candidatus Binataceae bacterium]
MIALLATAIAPRFAHAQGSAMPDSGYGSTAAGSAYASPDAMPTVAAGDEGDTSNSFAIPIPGGGDVTVEGPDAPVRNPLPPIGGWGSQKQTPNMPGTGPMDPTVIAP